MTNPAYSSPVLQIASDAAYSTQGDVYDGTPTKPTTTPALALVTQGARPSRQLAARLRNWIDSQVAAILSGLIADTAAIQANAVVLQSYFDPSANGMRLTAFSSQSVPVADQIGISTLYLVRHTSQSLWLFDSTASAWILRTPSATPSLTLSGLTAGSVYDVFAYWDGSTIQLELGAAWASPTTPNATVVTSGVRVKGSGAGFTRRLIGAFRATGAATTEDSASKRFVWNEANKVRRFLAVADTTASWTYTTAAWRQTRGATANKVEYLVRDAGAYVEARAKSFAASGTAFTFWSTGIGIDSTTVNSAQFTGNYEPTVNYTGPGDADYRGASAAGYHAINWLEYGGTTVVFAGSVAPLALGLVASVDM